MPTTKSPALDPNAPRTFRRGTTVTWAIAMSSMLAVVSVFIGSGLTDHGFFAVVAPICVAAPLITFAILSFYWPRVVVRDDTTTVRNAFATYEIPYPAIKDFRSTRIGLFIMLHDSTRVPVTAYASGSGSRAFGHKKAAQALIDAIEDKMSYAQKEHQDGGTRMIETTNIVISIISVLLAAGVLWAAIATY